MSPQKAWYALTEMKDLAQHLILLAKQEIDCDQIGMFALSSPGEYLHLVAVSGFAPEEAQFLQERTGIHSLSDYFDAEVVANLHVGHVCQFSRDRVHIPPEYEKMMRNQNVLIAPLSTRDSFIGVLITGKQGHGNVYSQENIEVVKAIATLSVLVLERFFVMYEWMQSQANAMALEETNRRMNDFLNLTSHELNTPLTSLMGNLQLAQHRLQQCESENTDKPRLARSFERMQHVLEKAWSSAWQMKHLINHMIDDSLLQSGNLVLHKQHHDMAELTREIVEDVQETHPQRVIRLSFAEPQPDYQVYIDRARIQDILYCFLDNALIYTANESPINVWVGKQDVSVRVAVCDQGPGIPPEEQPHVWKRFYRGKGVSIQHELDLSMGLSLYLCKRFVELNEGQVGLHSTPGMGAVFWFSLPLINHDSEISHQIQSN
ncbi:hypothetical protein KSX_60050 [Ktedonospora formicarum]|uniref:histidine kinase n=2 Tax=Ktedonospora formicarum TaxID=2778364 RepID=A0A8J3I881_9CHLR|nr:hypothetical protein KSX_60050 [Ktedonospora formicarum]